METEAFLAGVVVPSVVLALVVSTAMAVRYRFLVNQEYAETDAAQAKLQELEGLMRDEPAGPAWTVLALAALICGTIQLEGADGVDAEAQSSELRRQLDELRAAVDALPESTRAQLVSWWTEGDLRDGI